MAIEINARLVASKADLIAVGVDPTQDDDTIRAQVAKYLAGRLPYGINSQDVTVSIRRKVKKDNTNTY